MSIGSLKLKMLRSGTNATADSIIKLVLSASEAINLSYLKELILTLSTVKIPTSMLLTATFSYLFRAVFLSLKII